MTEIPPLRPIARRKPHRTPIVVVMTGITVLGTLLEQRLDRHRAAPAPHACTTSSGTITDIALDAPAMTGRYSYPRYSGATIESAVITDDGQTFTIGPIGITYRVGTYALTNAP